MKLSRISDGLMADLPKLIRQIAKENSIKEYEENPDFFDNRLEKWHQYSLLGHTEKVREAFLDKLPLLLKKWEVYETVQRKMSEKIDWMEKLELFDISIPLHDLGKIVCLHNTGFNREHEIASATLLGQGETSKRLAEHNLSALQIEYIRRCVETHDALGKNIRDTLNHSGNLRTEYLAGEPFKRICRETYRKFFPYGTEIGLYFICDSLGKLDEELVIKPDLPKREMETEIIKKLRARGLPSALRFGVMQQPLNLEIGRIYLQEAIHQE